MKRQSLIVILTLINHGNYSFKKMQRIKNQYKSLIKQQAMNLKVMGGEKIKFSPSLQEMVNPFMQDYTNPKKEQKIMQL